MFIFIFCIFYALRAISKLVFILTLNNLETEAFLFKCIVPRTDYHFAILRSMPIKIQKIKYWQSMYWWYLRTFFGCNTVLLGLFVKKMYVDCSLCIFLH